MLDEGKPRGSGDRIPAVLDPEFADDMRDVALDRAPADEQPLGDFWIREVLAEQDKNFPLPPREAVCLKGGHNRAGQCLGQARRGRKSDRGRQACFANTAGTSEGQERNRLVQQQGPRRGAHGLAADEPRARDGGSGVETATSQGRP